MSLSKVTKSFQLETLPNLSKLSQPLDPMRSPTSTFRHSRAVAGGISATVMGYIGIADSLLIFLAWTKILQWSSIGWALMILNSKGWASMNMRSWKSSMNHVMFHMIYFLLFPPCSNCIAKDMLDSHILLMEEILHQLIDSLSHHLQGLIHPRGAYTRRISLSHQRRITTYHRIQLVKRHQVSCRCAVQLSAPGSVGHPPDRPPTKQLPKPMERWGGEPTHIGELNGIIIDLHVSNIYIFYFIHVYLKMERWYK